MKNIYKRNASIITNFFIEQGIIDKNERAIYEYGFELLISSLAYACVFAFASFVTNTFWPSLIFFIGFYVVRTIGGGYHAETYLRCHTISILTHLIFILLYIYIPEQSKKHIFILFFLISAAILLVFAPVEHPNKRFINAEQKRFRTLCCSYSIFLLFSSILGFFSIYNKLESYLFCYAVGTLSAAVSIVVAKIKLKKGEK